MIIIYEIHGLCLCVKKSGIYYMWWALCLAMGIIAMRVYVLTNAHGGNMGNKWIKGCVFYFDRNYEQMING